MRLTSRVLHVTAYYNIIKLIENYDYNLFAFQISHDYEFSLLPYYFNHWGLSFSTMICEQKVNFMRMCDGVQRGRKCKAADRAWPEPET